MMKYRKLIPYKYQLTEDYSIQTDVLNHEFESDYLLLEDDGLLTIFAGYAWNGASGPAIDTKSILRASLIHDAFYQLLRSGEIPQEYRTGADLMFRNECLNDGVYSWRAWYCYWAVRLFGKRFAQIKKAPG